MADIFAWHTANMVNSAYIIRGLELLLVLATAWVLAGIMMQSNALTVPRDSTYAADTNDAQKASLDLAAIRETALFGVVEVVKKVTPTAAKPAPIAAVTIPPLPLKLWGTVVAGDASVAILAIANKPEQKVFHLHESIKDLVTLEVVWADAVKVLDHGRERRIELRKKPTTTTGQASAPVGAIPPAPTGGMLQRSISRKMINRQTRNFSALLSQARVVPHFVNGKTDGFVINNIVPRSLFQQIGLRNGDIIRKVNQAVISSAAQAMQLYQSLQKAAEIQLEVERAGQIQTINYHIQ